jgi:hypothetical protein
MSINTRINKLESVHAIPCSCAELEITSDMSPEEALHIYLQLIHCKAHIKPNNNDYSGEISAEYAKRVYEDLIGATST